MLKHLKEWVPALGDLHIPDLEPVPQEALGTFLLKRGKPGLGLTEVFSTNSPGTEQQERCPGCVLPGLRRPTSHLHHEKCYRESHVLP